MEISRNIELKARCGDLDKAHRAARELRAVPQPRQVQIDTYFVVPNGRLKLREIQDTRAELIWYDRPNQAVARDSLYHVIPTPEPLKLKAALSAALGVRGEVHKVRDIYLYENVRIHLDNVRGLGTFIEFEAVIGGLADVEPSRRRLAVLQEALEIAPTDISCLSYSDIKGL